MSALCTVLVVSKSGKSLIKNQMKVFPPLMVAFDNCTFEQISQYALDPNIHAVVFDGDHLNKAHIAELKKLLSHNWRSDLSTYWLHKTEESNPNPAILLGISTLYTEKQLIFDQVCRDLKEKASTPFFSALKTYVDEQPDSWHTPGHSNGNSLRYSNWGTDFYHFVGQSMWQADLSVSVAQLDSLLHPSSIIAEAQHLAAKAFGSKKTYFATNGSSTANKVILQSLLVPGDTLLLDRNCHKSVHHGVILSGAKPIYLDSSINEELGIFTPVPLTIILAAIDKHPEAKVIILTNPTYDGLRYDLTPIIAAAHKHHIKVIIDEAWYGFAYFHPYFRPTALELGADYVTQSTHKTMSAFSQASMVHVNDPEHNEHIFRETFNMHASTSPQYNIIASLDVARQQMSMEGYGLLEKALNIVLTLQQKINAITPFQVLTLKELLPPILQNDHITYDPTKVTIDIRKTGLSGKQIQSMLFDRFAIQIEKSTFATITVLVTIGATANKMMRLIHALETISEALPARKNKIKKPQLIVPKFTYLAGLPRDVFYEEGTIMPILKKGKPNVALIGKICCDQIVPYPPGIPILVPAQVIDKAILDYLGSLILSLESDEIHGIIQQEGQFYLRILDKQEEAKIEA